jgi:hypothetical protein
MIVYLSILTGLTQITRMRERKEKGKEKRAASTTTHHSNMKILNV